MEYTDVKEWLDWQIKDAEERRKNEPLNSDICAISTPDEIQMYKGIDIVADILGAELKERRLKEYYCYYFFYNDVEVLQLSDRRLGEYAGNG